MNPMRQKYTGIFFMVTVFLALLVIQVILYGNFFSGLKADTQIINDLSRVRGSIQRYVKLELSGVKVEGPNLETYIDDLLVKNIKAPRTGDLDSVSRSDDLKALESGWVELKSLVRAYHAAPDQEHLSAVIDKSEECWKIADAYVIQQQYMVNKTVTYFKYFTITFGVNLLFIALILLLYKRFIHNSLASSAIRDSLTGVFNKGYFNEYIEYEIARAVRKQTTFSLIMFDIDHFKQVNDSYGHRRGDYALKTLAEVVLKSKRNADVLARIGGEEFIILLPDTNLPEAAQLAERIRKSVEAFPFEEIGKMTISLGVTEFNHADHKEILLRRVDSALYLAKGNGRNRTEIIGGESNEQKSTGNRT